VELESSKILTLSSVIDAGVYLHDPTALLAAVNPSLLTYTEGAVRVQTTGITRGLTLLYDKQKR
jgi:inosine-uridine nucleoside N-ribohydrolase